MVHHFLFPFKPQSKQAFDFCIFDVNAALGSRLKTFVPGKVTTDIADYKEEMDQLGNFVRACVVPQGRNNVRARVVSDAYVASGTDPDADRWVPNYGDDDG